MVPEIMKVGTAVAVKSAVTMAPLIVTARLVGVNVKPLFDGATVYDPLDRPLNVYRPDESAVTVAVAAPVRATNDPAPPAAGLIVPEIENVGIALAVKSAVA